jgi:hypothetical protein
MMHAKALLFFLLHVWCFDAIAQTIHGEVLDMDNKRPVENVSIENVHTSLLVSTNNTGAFLIAAAGGQLLEFKKQGYKTTRVRIPNGYMPSFFRIIIKKGVSEMRDIYAAKGDRYDYTNDSVRYHELYKHALDFPKMSTFEMLASPFSAMSGKNREIWKFQDDYKEFEKEKYVDRTFNSELVAKFTGLKGDSLQYFMRRYRPSFEQLKAMNDYTFFNFIKSEARHYRSVTTPRGAR